MRHSIRIVLHNVRDHRPTREGRPRGEWVHALSGCVTQMNAAVDSVGR
jgi:hypothetical protein